MYCIVYNLFFFAQISTIILRYCKTKPIMIIIVLLWHKTFSAYAHRADIINQTIIRSIVINGYY